MQKISVITVNFNHRHGLSATIASVLSQSYPHIEYIIIDGGSTDGSRELIEQHAYSLSYWVSEKDAGIYDAMNKGIRHASGDYCLFLNSGDYLATPHVLANIFSKEQKSDLIIGRQLFYNAKGKHSKAPQIRIEEINISFFLSSTLPHQATFVKRDLIYKCGLYKTEYRIVADWVFWIEATIKAKCSMTVTSIPVSYMEKGGVSNDIKKCHDEMALYLSRCLMDTTLKWNDIINCAEKAQKQNLATRHKLTMFLNKIMIWVGKHY